MLRIAHLVLSTLLIGSLAIGCASSSASRAQRDRARTISLSEYQQAAKQLAVDIVSSPKFQRFREKEVEKNTEIVVMLDRYDTSTINDPTFATSIRQLFTALEEQFVENDLTFQQDLDPDGPNYSRAGERLDRQDGDDRYDPGTGQVTTGSAKKAVLSLQLEVQRSEVAESGNGSVYEYAIIARLATGQKVTLLSKSYPLIKRNR